MEKEPWLIKIMKEQIENVSALSRLLHGRHMPGDKLK